ncbi:MAG: exodeoxyribonuclease VII small subunit [Bacteroidetes bacterium 4572_112]|nr:MAG: exodeoxyribonuclease VII small subunit [Bacteroidetes bacterium 4572_112]
MTKENLKYDDAMLELEELVREMEYGEISVDELSEKIKRSAFLIKYCKSKLKSTEEDVAEIIKEMSEEG